MREYPVFMPFEGEHIAGVVTVPDETPQGVVVLLQGVGAPRSHRYRVWTRVARRLAPAGIASVRMDYRGMGDSTGPFGLDWDTPPVEVTRAVAEMGLRSVGVDRLGVVGNCLGARTALQVAPLMAECRSVVCVLPGSYAAMLESQAGPTRPARTVRRVTHRATWLRRAARMVRGRERPSDLGPPIPEVAQALRSSQVLFLHLGSEEGRRRVAAVVRMAASGIRERELARYEVSLIPAEGRSGFQPLPNQEAMVDAIVSWMRLTLTAQGPGGSDRDPPRDLLPLPGPAGP